LKAIVSPIQSWLFHAAPPRPSADSEPRPLDCATNAKGEMKMASFGWLIVVAALLAGCGSGGGASGTGATPGSGSQLDTGPTTATILIATKAPASATVLYAVDFTLHLPPGVTVSAKTSGEVLPDVLLVTDSKVDLAGARYQPATATTGGSVLVQIVDSTGFVAGPLASLTCTVARGTALGADGFTLDGFSARDSNGVAMPGVTAYFSLKTQ
jgi:hypothetical protein